jgi:hypothetical protein
METTELVGLLHDFGERWEIIDCGSYWTATRRPTPTSERMIAAHSASELRRKLADAGQAG